MTVFIALAVISVLSTMPMCFFTFTSSCIHSKSCWFCNGTIFRTSKGPSVSVPFQCEPTAPCLLFSIALIHDDFAAMSYCHKPQANKRVEPDAWYSSDFRPMHQCRSTDRRCLSWIEWVEAPKVKEWKMTLPYTIDLNGPLVCGAWLHNHVLS